MIASTDRPSFLPATDLVSVFDGRMSAQQIISKVQSKLQRANTAARQARMTARVRELLGLPADETAAAFDYEPASSGAITEPAEAQAEAAQADSSSAAVLPQLPPSRTEAKPSAFPLPPAHVPAAAFFGESGKDLAHRVDGLERKLSAFMR